MSKREKINVNKEYAKWCKQIARNTDEDELISHFRTHTYYHYLRHKPEGEIGLKVWLVGAMNFLNIFKEKYNVRLDDMLFECCIYLKEHKNGTPPSFDVDKFLKEHKSEVRDYYYRPARQKKWQRTK